MQTIEFLKSVLSDEGYYCTISIDINTEITVRKLHSSIEEAYERSQSIPLEGFDSYFSTATFETDKSSKAANVKYKKAFYLDIDCGPSKAVPNDKGVIAGYIDQATGLAELRKFCKLMSLPKPTLINSGRGIHAYWPLTESISVDAWLPIAEKLKAACKQHNLIIDPAVPADAARILRVPGSLNFKDTPPSDVNVVGELAPSVSFEKFTECFEDIVAGSNRFVPNIMDDVTNALAGSYSNSFKLIMQKTAVGKGCAQLGYAITNQAEIGYPMWIAALSVAKFCTDSEKAIHKLSAKHPDYNPTTTEKRVASIKGPYRCSTFDEYNPGVCGSCPFKGKFGSPIVLGREVQEASEEDNIIQDRPEITAEVPLQTYVIPQYPAPYFRGKAGGVFKKAKDKEGDPVEVAVYHNDMYITRRLNDPDVGESVVMRLHLPKDGVREFTVPLVNLLSKDEFRKSVAPKGVAVLDMGELMSYTNSWVNKLQATAAADLAHRQFGWSDDRKVAFIVGEKEIRGDRVDINPPAKSTSTLFPAFQSKGSIEGWRSVMEFYNRPKMELHQYVIGLSFGSPLMAFTPINASLFHMYSKDTGVGKTTASKAALGIWGNPDQLIMQEQDTPNSKMNRLEMLKNVFAVFDELTNIEPKDASDMMYQITGGLQRNRMSGKGNEERFRGAPWHTNGVSTGNTSLLERVSLYKAVPKAEAGRVLEYRVEPHRFDTKVETDDLSVAITQHYGHACIPYMQYIIQNLAEVHELFKDTQKRIDTAAGLSQPHRFWSVQAASSVTGLIVAKRVGLINFDIAAIVAWIIDVLITAKGDLATMSGTVEDLLASYLSENYNNVLRIRSTDDARGSNPDALEHLIAPDATPRMALVARYEYDVKKMYLLPKPLRQWCVRNQHNYSALVNGLKEGKTKATSKKMRMGKGTNMNLPSAEVWILDCTDFGSDEIPIINGPEQTPDPT